MRWYKRFGADFIDGTMSLTLEEKGAYSLCLDLIYSRGGAIPDDPRWLAGICNVSLRKWARLRQRLINLEKLVEANGLLSNARADTEIASAKLSSRKLSESGAKGGRNRAENEAKTKENKDLAEASLKHTRIENREEKKEQVTPPDGGQRYAFQGRIIRLTAVDFERWEAAYPDLGLQVLLQSRDDWLATEADEQTRKRWFVATSNYLANRQQDIETQRREARLNDAKITV